jgi:hypothetical protein
VPEHDDDDRDEAGDAYSAGPGTHGRSLERDRTPTDDEGDTNDVR